MRRWLRASRVCKRKQLGQGSPWLCCLPYKYARSTLNKSGEKGSHPARIPKPIHLVHVPGFCPLCLCISMCKTNLNFTHKVDFYEENFK